MEEREHNLKMENRNHLELTGVLQAESSDEKRVNLKTTLGDMVIEGEGLGLRHLDLTSGNAVIGGRVDGIFYPLETLRSKNKKRDKGLGGFFK